MNTQTSQTARLSTDRFLHVCVLISAFLMASVVRVDVKAFEIDWSRRRTPASLKQEVVDVKTDATPTNWTKEVFQGPRPSREIAMIHSDQGFFPNQIVMDDKHVFEIKLVNVDPKRKTASFFIDQFGVQQGMPFGNTQTLRLSPKKPGNYFITSPESGFEAKITVIASESK